MSIAYGFDPNISPIYEDDDDDHEPGTQHSVHFSSADTPKKSGRVANQTMGASRISIDFTGDFHDFHKECAPEITESMEEIVAESEEFREEIHVEYDDEVVPDSREGLLEDDLDETVPESVGYLEGTFIVLSAGCCLPIRHHLSKKLKEMGAEVQKTVDDRTTHIVVDRYADESIVGTAMSRTPEPPLMVDVKWIQECLDNRKKCEETDYSMRGLRYLRQTCRRLSSFREPTPFGDLEETHWEDMDNDAPLDPAKLLEEIKKLSERIDALMDYAPVIRFEYHSPDCPTRQRPGPPVPPIATTQKPSNPTNSTPEAFRRLLTSISSGTTIRRRRSFTGFIFEHREPQNDVVEVQKSNKDVRDTWKQPENPRKNNRRQQQKSPRKAITRQKTVNDMRKTMAADLTSIRVTLGRNADLNRARTPKKAQKPAKRNLPTSRTKMEPVRADDSDIQSALASLTISDPPPAAHQNSRQSIEIIEDISTSNRRHVPLVPTKSNVINRLQKTFNPQDDDDFISDVSAFIKQNRTNSAGRKLRKVGGERGGNEQEEEEVEENERRNEVVFTGFNKDSSIEKKLKSIVRRFKLNVTTEIDERRTLCVVSRHGKRTLVVLKAICCDVPIVRPQWLEESFEDSQLLSSDDYIYQEWLQIRNQKIFENFHSKMWISPDCTPEAKDLAWMVEKCGGTVTRHLHRADLVIAPETWEFPDEIDKVELEIATPLFIIDSISMAGLQDYRDYVS